MWIMLVVVVAVLLASAGGIYLLLKNMGQSGIEAAAPGSCRSGRCGVDPMQSAESGCRAAGATVQSVRIDEITRKDARSPEQTL
jgi:hypothetical protein